MFLRIMMKRVKRYDMHLSVFRISAEFEHRPYFCLYIHVHLTIVPAVIYCTSHLPLPVKCQHGKINGL